MTNLKFIPDGCYIEIVGIAVMKDKEIQWYRDKYNNEYANQ